MLEKNTKIFLLVDNELDKIHVVQIYWYIFKAAKFIRKKVSREAVEIWCLRQTKNFQLWNSFGAVFHQYCR